MAKPKLTGEQLRKIGYPQSPVIGIAMDIIEKNFNFFSAEVALEILPHVLEHPENYQEDKVLGNIALALLPEPKELTNEISFKAIAVKFKTFGTEGMDYGLF